MMMMLGCMLTVPSRSSLIPGRQTWTQIGFACISNWFPCNGFIHLGPRLAVCLGFRVEGLRKSKPGYYSMQIAWLGACSSFPKPLNP